MVKNIVSQKFGSLEVIRLYGINKHRQSMWECLCICGKYKIVQIGNLTSGEVRSCGCVKKGRDIVDITGKRFGSLVVNYYWDTRKESSRWFCRCDCGNYKIVVYRDLLSGHCKSCGCLTRKMQRDSKIKHGLSYTPEYKRFKVFKRNESKRFLDSEWTPQMEFSLCQFHSVCVLCNTDKDLCTDHVYPLSKGHGLKPGNAVRLCRKCNSSKSNKYPEEMSDEIRRKILTAALEFKRYWDLQY